MKITPRKNHGAVLLAVIALLALAGIVYLGYKIISHLMKHPIDPNHGQGTNDTEMVTVPLDYYRELGVSNVWLPEYNATLPLESLACEWRYVVSTSTNLIQWQETALEWEEAQEMARTNHNEGQRFWRLELRW